MLVLVPRFCRASTCRNRGGGKVSVLSFQFTSYNQEAFMFAKTVVEVTFEDYGSLKLDIFTKATNNCFNWEAASMENTPLENTCISSACGKFCTVSGKQDAA